MNDIQMPQADRNGFVSTLNNMGYMVLSLDSYTQDFLQFCKDNKNVTVFEGGAAYGEVCLAALQAGATVFANDMEKKHLELLAARTPSAQRSALHLCPGCLPYDINFQVETFDAILCSRMLDFLSIEEIDFCFKKFYSWLKVGGKLYAIAETPYIKPFSSFIPIYETRKKNGEKCPGVMENISDFMNSQYDNLPKYLNLLDVETLVSACEKNGFVVEKCEFLNRTDFPPEVRLDGRENVAIKAIKN
jgi:hypothetical protein